MNELIPLPGRALVEIREKYKHVAVTEQKHESKTSGLCVAIAPIGDEQSSYDKALGKIVYWEEYKDGEIIEYEDARYTFVKLEDLDGYKNGE